MRHLIDSYIQASDSEKISAFEDTSLLEIIVKQGIKKAIEKLPKAIGEDRNAIAETIENNVRKLITDERSVNPKYLARITAHSATPVECVAVNLDLKSTIWRNIEAIEEIFFRLLL